jgi:ribose-phosphate pyrophosphokinase
MHTLDLTSLQNSDFKYKISRFPDGQQSIDIEQDSTPVLSSSVTIKSRMNSFSDLELIICANKALRNLKVSKVELYVPYFLGARSDRKFKEGGVNYLKDVICPIVNMQKFDQVTVMDPHSDVLEACLENYQKIDNSQLVEWSLKQLENELCLISPDAGAFKKIYDLARKFNLKNIVTASKVRDLETGEILHTEVPISVHDAGKNFLIIDDICDGGRTFIEIAKGIREREALSSVTAATGKIYLVVTHGIFSAGFESLVEHIDGIFCTNSVKEIDISSLPNGYLRQYNVF